MTTRAATAAGGVGETALEQRFCELARRWSEETAFCSMSWQLVEHPAYREILGIGEAAVPWILREMEHGTARWSYALEDITGENPAADAKADNFAQVREAWLAWGHERFPDK